MNSRGWRATHRGCQLLAVLALVSLGACRWTDPAVIDQGKACTADAPCAGGLSCVQGYCAAAAGSAAGSGTTGGSGSAANTSASGTSAGGSSTTGPATGTATAGSSAGAGSSSGSVSGSSSSGTSSGTTGPTTFYIAPAGSDQASGQSASTPFLTFGFAVKQLAPGDTLLLLDGTYTIKNNDALAINCRGTGHASNGLVGSPITVQAKNERAAFLQGTGAEVPVQITGCSYWNIVGLHVESADLQSGGVGGVVALTSTQSISLRRLLVAHTNRFVRPTTAITVALSKNALVEECEVYDYSGTGLSFQGETSLSTARRNYLNDRNFKAFDGGSQPTGIQLLNGSRNVVENNIVEGAEGYPVGVQANTVSDAGVSGQNDLFGDIALARDTGFALSSDCGGLPQAQGLDCAIAQTLVLNDLALGGNVGFAYTQGVANSFLNDSAFDAAVGFQASYAINNAGFVTSGSFVNDVSVGGTFGVVIDPRLGLDVRSSDTDAESDAGIVPVDAGDSTDLALPFDLDGGCLAYAPTNSPVLKKGWDGGPLGATVVDEYVNGSLTSVPLWSPDSGAFPCGATAPGINDTDAGNCRDVNRRVNIGTASCAIP